MALTYINAGTPPDYRSLGIYVKYGDFKRFEVLEDCTKYSHMILPDREICIFRYSPQYRIPAAWNRSNSPIRDSQLFLQEPPE